MVSGKLKWFRATWYSNQVVRMTTQDFHESQSLPLAHSLKLWYSKPTTGVRSPVWAVSLRITSHTVRSPWKLHNSLTTSGLSLSVHGGLHQWSKSVHCSYLPVYSFALPVIWHLYLRWPLEVNRDRFSHLYKGVKICPAKDENTCTIIFPIHCYFSTGIK